MTSTDPSPATATALVSWAHVDPGWNQAETARRKEQVVRLAQGLRGNGIDVDVDLFHGTEDIDWTRWGPTRIRDVDIVLIVVSQAWRDAWEGRGDTTRNIGAAAEADTLHTLYSNDRTALISKCRLIVLSGSEADIPDGLHGIPRFHLNGFDDADLEDLLRDLTNQPAYVLAPLGRVPVLPAVTTSLTPKVADGDAAAASAASSKAPGRRGTANGAGEPDDAAAPGDDADEVRQLRDALRALPTPLPGEGPHLPWYRTRETIMRRLAELGALDSPDDPGDDPDGPGGPDGPGAPGASSGHDGGPSAGPAAHPGTEVEAGPSAADPGPQWRSLETPADLTWYQQWHRGGGFGYDAAAVVVHILPQPGGFSERVFAEASDRALGLIRARDEVSATDDVSVQQQGEAMIVNVERSEPWQRNQVLPGTLKGARIAKTGQVSAWRTLPRDHMGAVVDMEDLHAAVLTCLQTAASMLPNSPAAPSTASPAGQDPRVVVAAELIHVTGITDSTLTQLGNRSSAGMRGALRGDVSVGGDETMKTSSLYGDHVHEVARVLTTLLDRRWRS